MNALDVQELFDRVPGWKGRAHVVRSLDGGITNRNLLVEVGDQLCVLRLAGTDTHLLEINRMVEHEAAKSAADLGIGPEVVAFLEPEGYLVTRFISAEPLPVDQLKATSNISEICKLLQKFHSTARLSSDFNAFEVPYLHRSAAVSRGIAIPAAFERAADATARIKSVFEFSPEQIRPCHNDLLNANFLVDASARIWLLDWEYSGNNDRYFDLGNLCVNNEFDADCRENLLYSYFGSVNARRSGRLELMMIMSDFREAMWAVVQQGISKLDFDFRGYATKHFDRLLAAASAMNFERLLADAAGGTPDA